MRINKTCETCEFNFEGVCTGEGNYSYGQKLRISIKNVMVGGFLLIISQK